VEGACRGLDITAYLPFEELALESLPCRCPRVLVQHRPVAESDSMALNVQPRVLTPVDRGVIPHLVQSGDVVDKGHRGWIRYLSESELELCAIAKYDGVDIGCLSRLAVALDNRSERWGRHEGEREGGERQQVDQHRCRKLNGS
jgi:hypothetical protein